MPLFQLPQLVTQLVNAKVALSRLEELLAANQQDLLKLQDPATKGVAEFHDFDRFLPVSHDLYFSSLVIQHKIFPFKIVGSYVSSNCFAILQEAEP